MKFSDTYLFYPVNKALELAIEISIGNYGEEFDAAAPDTSVTAADIFLYTRGNFEQHRFSANILDSARERLEASLPGEGGDPESSARAMTLYSLGNILAAQGQQQRDVERYKKAISCFNAVLEALEREKSPLDWAAAQTSLGTAKQALGRQQHDSKLLKESIAAYTNALLEWSRKDTPAEWASAMHQLGAAFHAFGTLLKGNRTFQKSVVAYKNAIAGFDADNHAFELAAAHNNCGAVLHNLAESEENPDRLEEAIRSYETALTVCMEQQLPIHLAVLCRVNRSTARSVMAEMANDAALSAEAADDFELIVECFPQALQPLCLKYCEEQISKARSHGSCDQFSQMSR